MEYRHPILAFDPGVNGGWCTVDIDGNLDWGPMPPEIEKDPFLKGIAWGSFEHSVVIEHQQLAHKMTSGGGKLMRQFGFLQGFFSLRHRIHTVHPKAWQFAYRIQGSRGLDRKRAIKAVADQKLADLQPTGRVPKGKRLTLKTCDAFLIALYVDTCIITGDSFENGR